MPTNAQGINLARTYVRIIFPLFCCHREKNYQTFFLFQRNINWIGQYKKTEVLKTNRQLDRRFWQSDKYWNRQDWHALNIENVCNITHNDNLDENCKSKKMY